MAETFTFFDDVIDYVKNVLDAFGDFSKHYDCRAIAKYSSSWDEDLQKFVLTKEGDDFYAVVLACALA